MELYAWYCRGKDHVETWVPTSFSESMYASLRLHKALRPVGEILVPLREPATVSSSYKNPTLRPADKKRIERTADGLLRRLG